MLIEFSVKNFRSIKDQVRLSMVANTGNEHEKTHTVLAKNSGLRLLRTAAIYGPNASGKSNLLKAFGFMRHQILNSVRSQSGDEIDAEPHLFDTSTTYEPTEVEAIFLVNNIRYQYGFSATKERIHEEWLFAYPKGRAQTWIMRKYIPETDTYISKIEYIKGQKKNWIDSTRKEALILSTAVQLNSEDLRPIFEWFKDHTAVIGVDHDFSSFTARTCKENDKKTKIINALSATDMNIEDIILKEETIELSSLPKDMPDEIKKKIVGKKYERIFARHSVIGGGYVDLELDEESQGTQKFFSLIGPWLEILDSGDTVFIDEFSDKLHPLLMRYLINMFYNDSINKHGAQLILTTHDTSLLKQEYLRRDQIWFVQKKSDNSTKLYPLTNFKPRKDRENIEKNYLSGNYGALPYLRDIAKTMGVE